MITVAIANQKGGVGKTTTAVNLGAALARSMKNVLLVDLDPQASLTEYFCSPLAVPDYTIYQALLQDHDVLPRRLGEYISLLPSSIDLAAAEIQLPAKLNAQQRLARVLRNYERDFDYCLVDCPPSLGILTVNALSAASLVLVPVATELLAERTVRLILDTVGEVKDSGLNPDLAVWRILPTLFDSRLLHHREILAALYEKYEKTIYPIPVPLRVVYKDAGAARADVGSLDANMSTYWDELAGLLIRETIL